MFPAEPLDPNLAEHVYDSEHTGTILHHPLVVMPFFGDHLYGVANRQFREKTDALAVALKHRDWDRYISLHERPYRLPALQHLINLNTMTGEEHWSMVAEVWIDSENIREFQHEWNTILAADINGRHHIMSTEERTELAAMPDTLTIYQGHTTGRDDGWSWTLNLSTACWFATRFTNLEADTTSDNTAFPDFPAGTPLVSTVTVNRDDVLAYFTSRSEAEILIAPKYTQQRTTQPASDLE